jgi:hypothetical protein
MSEHEHFWERGKDGTERCNCGFSRRRVGNSIITKDVGGRIFSRELDADGTINWDELPGIHGTHENIVVKDGYPTACINCQEHRSLCNECFWGGGK